jgi:ABC-type nitrate/sulfonate/bicarbonate transport system permease component
VTTVRHVLNALPGGLFIVAVFGAVECVSRLGVVNQIIVPPPSTVLTTFFNMLGQRAVGMALLQTLGTLFAGYAIGCVLAIVLGIFMGSVRVFRYVLEPVTEVLRPLPKAAVLPALMLFLGIGETMKITLVGLAVFFPVLINAAQGARTVDPTMVNMARTFGYRRLAVLRRVVLPASLPYIIAGMRISLGIGIVMAVLAEMLSANGGVGAQLIAKEREYFVTETYAWVLLLALLGLILNWLFVIASRRLLFWQTASSDGS